MLDTRISIDLGQSSLDKSILQLQQATGFSFAYESSGLESLSAPPGSFKKEKLSDILHYLLDGTGYIFAEKHNVVIIGPGPNVKVKPAPTYQFNGVIEDKETGAKLEGVAVYDPTSKTRGTFTDHNGYFSLTATSDTLKLRLSYLSYKPVEIVLRAANAPLIYIKMNIANEGLDSVLIGDPGDVSPVFLNKLSPSIPKMSFLPKFCGDVDLLGLLKVTPGVQEARDGSGTLIVRGGAPDQNLLLVDDATIYGATHLFGLVSSVNAHAVREVGIYKGAFPARLSGRISSVWDIYLKDGDPEKIHGVLLLGTMASDLMLEGPLDGKTTFMVAARRSYHDFYTRFFTPSLTFYFQDIDFKLHRRLSEKDHLFLTGYASGDKFKLDIDEPRVEGSPIKRHTIKLNMQNYAGVLRWRHDYSANLLSNFSLIYSAHSLEESILHRSTYLFTNEDGVIVYHNKTRKAGLYDLTGKFQVKYNPTTHHEIEGGLYYTRHTFNSFSHIEDITATDPDFLTPQYFEDQIRDTASQEMGGYLEDKIKITDALKAAIGFHINNYVYEKKSYLSFQPRVNISYQVGASWFLNAAYVKMQQNLHRLTISETNLPVDFWIPSTNVIKPQTSDQVSLGISGRLWEGLFDMSVESYYKSMNNVAEYLVFTNADTSQPERELSWTQEVTVGKGAAYGIEFALRKSQGNWNFWLSYALAWSNRTLPEVNNGVTFPYKYDRRHNLNLVALCKLSRSLELSAVFTFQSRPKTPVLIIRTADQSPDAETMRLYASETDVRAYHRLDLGINWNKAYKSGVTSTWNLSVFNVYNRENTFYYFSSENQISGNALLPIAAALSYTLRF